jgi:hypothetical protein
MSFYKLIQEPETLAVRLSPKRPEKTFHPKWHVKGQDVDYVAIGKMLPSGIFGLYLGEGEIYYHNSSASTIPCVLLLIGEQRWYIPEQSVTVLSEKEIEQVLNDEQEQPTA